jgi:hypothetical protein
MNRDLVSLCCAGRFCKGNESTSKVVYQFIPGLRTESEVIVWLRLGRHDMFVNDLEPLITDALNYNVVETLGRSC